MPSIGREFTEMKQVLPGSHEYTSVIEIRTAGGSTVNSSNTATGSLSALDSLSMVFDNDVILDDITVRNPQGILFSLRLVFPTGTSLLLTGDTTDFSINLPGSGANLWYRIPKWTKLKLSISPEEAGDGLLQVSAVGRAG